MTPDAGEAKMGKLEERECWWLTHRGRGGHSTFTLARRPLARSSWSVPRSRLLRRLAHRVACVQQQPPVHSQHAHLAEGECRSARARTLPHPKDVPPMRTCPVPLQNSPILPGSKHTASRHETRG